MDAERDKREVRKKMYFERYSPVIILDLEVHVYGEVDNINLGKTFFPNCRLILSQNKNTYCEKNPRGTAVGMIS